MSRVILSTRSLSLISLLCLTFLTSGCGDGRPTRVKVSGHVTVDGKPLKVGGISFKPTSDGRMAGGALGEGGRYFTTMYKENDGLPLGSYTVAVSGVQSINDASQRWNAPKKYADHETSGLKVEITQEVEDLNFDLTWEGDDHSGPWVESLE